MASIKGTDGIIKIGPADDSESPVAQVKSYSLTESAETAETTVMGNDSKTHVPTLKSWEGSLDVVYDNQDVGASLKAGAQGFIELYPSGEATGGTNYKYSGAIVVTSFEVTGDVADLVSGTLNFTGTDDLAHDVIS